MASKHKCKDCIHFHDNADDYNKCQLGLFGKVTADDNGCYRVNDELNK